MTTEFDQRDFDYTNTPEAPPSGSSALVGPTYKILARLLNRFTGLTGTSDFWTLPTMTVQGIINALPTTASTTVEGVAELATTGEAQTGTDATRIVTPVALRAGTDMLAKKADVRVASMANINLGAGGLLTVDGSSLSAGDRVLAKNQTTNTENGLYDVAVGAWTRAKDANESADFQFGQEIRVRSGTQAGVWYLSGATAVTLGTTPIVYSPTTSSAAHSFWSSAHTDVDDTDTPVDGEVVAWDATATKWKSVPRYVDTSLLAGLQLEWISTTQVRIKSGACYIPASGKVVSKSTDTTYTPTSPALAANTLYYLYAVESAGTLAFEHATTTPAYYFGTALQRNDSNARRYVGEFRTAVGSTNIVNFRVVGNKVMYRPGQDSWRSAPYDQLPGGKAGSTITTVTVSATSIIPDHCRMIVFEGANYADQQGLIGDPATLSPTVYDHYIETSSFTFAIDQALNDSRQFGVRLDAASTNALFGGLTGYYRVR